MSPGDPLISAVIPTLGRPQLVTRAVASALGQSLTRIEVIVVVDGPDEESLGALRAIDDPRLRILPLPENLGLGRARHAGIDVARGRFVALLDDDDEWLPRKLEIQLDAASRSRHRLPVVACRVIARSATSDAIRPRRYPASGEPLSEYLFCRTRLTGGEGLVLPSALLAPRELLRDVRFADRGTPFEGSDWLLRAVAHDGVGVEFVPTPEPLVVWHCEETRARISTTHRWRASLAWADARADLLTPRARAGFLLGRVSFEARRVGEARAFWLLLREAFRGGRPSAIGLLAHLLIWLVPRRVRASIAALVDRRFSFARPSNAHRPGA